MTYTNLPPAWTDCRGGSACIAWSSTTAASIWTGTSGRVIGPEHIGNKDAVIFNLTDGRVALMHRIHPNIQLAVFDSLDAMWHGDAAYWNDHLEHLDRTRSSPRHRAR